MISFELYFLFKIIDAVRNEISTNIQVIHVWFMGVAELLLQMRKGRCTNQTNSKFFEYSACVTVMRW